MEDEPQHGKPASDVRTPTPGHTKHTPDSARQQAESNKFRLLGKTFGRDPSGNGGYQLTAPFTASGGTSIIYKGVEVATGKPVIVKALRDSYTESPEGLLRFGEEANAAEMLKDHPHIMSPLAHGDEDGDLYIVYEFIPNAIDHSNTTTDPKEDAEVLRQTLDALIYAHSKGVLHRDVKPSNTLVKREKDGIKSWLLDFGLGKIKFKGESSIQTVQGSLMGTTHYISPEQAEDLSSADERSDLYSLACTAYYIHSETLPCEDEKDIDARDNLANSRVITNRIDKSRMFDLWINDAVVRKRHKLSERIKKEKAVAQEEINEAKIRKLETQLKNTEAVSEDYQDLWMRVILAKDRAMRPKTGQILSKLETLIQEDRVLPRKLTPDELKKTSSDYTDMHAQLESSKAGIEKLRTSTEKQDVVIKRRYNLLYSMGQSLERLTELTPRTDEMRLAYVRDAVNYYGEAKTLLRMNRRLFENSEKQVAELDDILLWARNTQHLEYKRKQHREANIEQTRAKDLIVTVNQLIQTGDYAGAATEYRQITTTKLPDESRATFTHVTEKLRMAALDEVAKGEAALGRDSEAAKKHYDLACKFKDALRGNAEGVDEKVKSLEREMRKHTVTGLRENYKSAEAVGDFYEMASCLDELENHSDLDEETRSMVTQGKDLLTLKRDDIDLLRQFVRNAEQLEKRIGEYTVMTAAEIEEYSADINSRIKKLDTAINPENIGAYHEQFKSHLQGLLGEVKSYEWTANIHSQDYVTRVTSLFNLTMHHRSRDDKEKEVEYGQMLARELRDNLTERETMIRKKDK